LLSAGGLCVCGHVALASITEPSGHVWVCGAGGGVGHIALASITEPSGHVCVCGVCGVGVCVCGHDGSFGFALQSTAGGVVVC
jgi:hypothetical protein